MRILRYLTIAGVLLFLASGCQSTLDPGDDTYGKASYYGKKYHGRKTASGERFNMWAYTAAHRTLPFGAVLRVTNRKNRKQVTVRINDRGPFVSGRIIDLSYAAAKRIDMIRDGVVEVRLERLK